MSIEIILHKSVIEGTRWAGINLFGSTFIACLAIWDRPPKAGFFDYNWHFWNLSERGKGFGKRLRIGSFAFEITVATPHEISEWKDKLKSGRLLEERREQDRVARQMRASFK